MASAATPKTVAFHQQGNAVLDIAPEVAQLIRDRARPGMRTLETGAGRSTLMFVEAGTDHEAVSPSPDEHERILAEAARLGLDTSRLRFHVGFSQDVLPRLSGELDMVLIDGGHGFPIPAVDWAYLAPRLKVGGTLLIDDVDLWTGAMIVDFLRHEKAWRYEGCLRGRTAVFRLLAPCKLEEFTEQPYVLKRSRWPQRFRKASNLLRHLRDGEFNTLRSKIKRDFGSGA